MLLGDKMKSGQSERAAYPNIRIDIRIREPSFIGYSRIAEMISGYHIRIGKSGLALWLGSGSNGGLVVRVDQ